MGKYFAITATNKRVKEDWGGTSSFTDSALDQMVESAPGKAVLFEFDPGRQVGMIMLARNDNGKLCVTAMLDDEYLIDKDQRLVPSFIVFQDEWVDIDSETTEAHRTIQGANIYCFGLTHTPIEQDLPEIEKI